MREPTDEQLRLLIVVVVYRVADLTIECLRSLMPEVRSLAGVKVAVCENGSGGDVADRLRTAIREHGWEDAVWFLPIHPNRGFTGGNNAILDRALRWKTPPEFFMLLNSDTIVHSGAIAELLASIESNPRVGALGPSLIGPDGSLQTSCFRDPTPWSEFLRAACTGPLDRLFHLRRVSTKPPHGTGPHEWTSFAASMIRSSTIAQTGTFDEGYYLYFDDPDLCWRMRCAGWRIAHCPTATIVHLEGAANDVPASRRERRRPPRYLYQSRARYFAKRHGVAGLWLANLCWHAGRCVSLLRELLGRRPIVAAPCEWRDIWTNALRPWHAPHLPYPEAPPSPPESATKRGSAADVIAS